MDARVRLLLLAVLTACAAVLGVRAGRLAAEAPGEAPWSVAPVERPADLLGEVVIASPDASWRKAQLAVGGALVLAPPTFGALLAYRAGMPELGGVIDGTAPAYGVVDGKGAWVLAARATSAARARSSLTALPRVEGPAGIELHAEGSRAIGIADTWILVGSDRDAVVRLGPFAYRNVPRAPLPQSAVAFHADQAALAGPAREVLERRLADLEDFLRRAAVEQRRVHGGREPDLADTRPFAEALLVLGRRYADAVTGMDHLDVSIDVDDTGIGARATLAPPAAGPTKDWVAAMGAGEAAQLAAASQTAVATVFWRSTEAERKQAAASAAAALPEVLGTRVPSADVARLAAVLQRTPAARGDWTLASVESQSGAGVVLRLGARDPRALASAVEDAVDAFGMPGWAAWERGALGVSHVERKGSLATFKTEQASLSMTWASTSDELDVAVGFDAATSLAKAFPERGLAADGAVGPWLRSLGSGVVWAAVVRPLMLGPSLQMDPLLVALVRRGDELQLRAHATGSIVRQTVVGAL